jgi:hypothetical protein
VPRLYPRGLPGVGRRSPRSHVINQPFAGDHLLHCAWDVANAGNAPGSAQLKVSRNGHGTIGTGGARPIDPGQTLTLSFQVVSGLVPGESGTFVLAVEDTSGATPTVAGSPHTFTVIAEAAPSGNSANLTFVSASIAPPEQGQSGEYLWSTTVRNDELPGGLTGRFRPTASQTNDAGGPITIRLDGLALFPGESQELVTIGHTLSSFISGEIWAEEWTLGDPGAFIRELPGSRSPYLINF